MTVNKILWDKRRGLNRKYRHMNMSVIRFHKLLFSGLIFI